MKKENTGCVRIQIEIFTQHIINLTKHLKKHKKDHQAKKGLLTFVIKRKRLLIYLNRNSKIFEI